MVQAGDQNARLLNQAVETALDTGTASAGGALTLTDAQKDWPVNIWSLGLTEVEIIEGTGWGQHRLIASNTATVITVTAGWTTVPDATSRYAIRLLAPASVVVESILAKFLPVSKALVFNTAEPAADADILGAAIAPTNSPSWFRVYACFSNAGILRIRRTRAAVTVSENLYEAAALTAAASYMFSFPVLAGDTINFWYSVTGGTILALRVLEIGAAE